MPGSDVTVLIHFEKVLKYIIRKHEQMMDAKVIGVERIKWIRRN